MTRHALLNNVTHKDLRVITRHGAEFGDNTGTVPTFPTEYADVLREYPIFFRKEPDSGEFQSVILLGFSKDENLYLGEDGRWDASYIPGIIARGPFLIGFQEQEIDGNVQQAPVIHVDMDHPRVSQSEGEAVFMPQGGNSRYLDNIAVILRGLGDGMAISKAMFAAFTALDLIEPVKLEIKLSAEDQYNILGLQTINIEKLRALEGEALTKLNKSGFLQGAYLVLASQGNIKNLIARKQRRLMRAPA